MGDPEGRREASAYDSGELKTIDRIAWAMQYCKPGGLLDSPRRALHPIIDEGARIPGLFDADARGPVDQVWQLTQRTFTPKKDAAASESDSDEPDDGTPVEGED